MQIIPLNEVPVRFTQHESFLKLIEGKKIYRKPINESLDTSKFLLVGLDEKFEYFLESFLENLAEYVKDIIISEDDK